MSVPLAEPTNTTGNDNNNVWQQWTATFRASRRLKNDLITDEDIDEAVEQHMSLTQSSKATNNNNNNRWADSDSDSDDYYTLDDPPPKSRYTAQQPQQSRSRPPPQHPWEYTPSGFFAGGPHVTPHDDIHGDQQQHSDYALPTCALRRYKNDDDYDDDYNDSERSRLKVPPPPAFLLHTSKKRSVGWLANNNNNMSSSSSSQPKQPESEPTLEKLPPVQLLQHPPLPSATAYHDMFQTQQQDCRTKAMMGSSRSASTALPSLSCPPVAAASSMSSSSLSSTLTTTTSTMKEVDEGAKQETSGVLS